VRRTQKKLAIAVAFAAAAALAASAFVLRGGIERGVHLLRLRSDPSLFDEMLASGSPAREAACRDFVNEPAGKEALFRLYLVEFGRAAHAREKPGDGRGPPQFIAEMRDAPFERAAIALWEEGRSCLTWRKGGHSSYSMANLKADRRKLQRVLDLLPKLAGETIRLPDVDGLEFRVARAVDLRSAGPLAGWAPDLAEKGWGEDALRAVAASIHPAADLVCFFRKT
jgi:hypothetical protein